jgi:ATP-dependent RNA helicase DDX19/DBP5
MLVVVAMGKFTPVQTEYAIKDNLPRGVSRRNHRSDAYARHPCVRDESVRLGWSRRHAGSRRLGTPNTAGGKSKACFCVYVYAVPLTAYRLYSICILPRNNPVQIILFSATSPDHMRMFVSKFAPPHCSAKLLMASGSSTWITETKSINTAYRRHSYNLLVSSSVRSHPRVAFGSPACLPVVVPVASSHG